MENRRKRRLLRLVLFVLPGFLVLFALMVWAVSALWNWLMPPIFGVRAVTYWQALGLLVLSWILFRGFRGPSMARSWRHDLRSRWRRMTPAEREEFIQGLRARYTGMEPPEPEARL